MQKNAFVGYAFQEQVFRYLVLLMDVDRSILSVEAEIGSDGKIKFDDIKVDINGKELFFQVKNISDKNVFVDQLSHLISHGSSQTPYDPKINCVYLYNHSESKFSQNVSFLNHPAYCLDSLIILPLTTDSMWDDIEHQYSDHLRITQIIRWIDTNISNRKTLINHGDLPSLSFFSLTLSDENYKIRDFTLETSGGTVWVFGKPGVGKSHLLNEMNIDDNDMYRFWISETDKDRANRLQYPEFQRELSAKLFFDNGIHSEQSIIDNLSMRSKYFFIDGIDHVENYNVIETEKFMSFFEKIIISNAKVVFLSRPLQSSTLSKAKCQVELRDWNEEETNSFCKFEGISDFAVQKRIFEIGGGYPIITRYLVEEYKIHSEIAEFPNRIKSVHDFYSLMVTKENRPILKILSFFPSYFTLSEIKEVSPDSFEILSEFVKNRAYLFVRRLNRFYFFHDSFVNFLTDISISESNEQIRNNLQSTIERSVLDGSPEYMSRLTGFFDYTSGFFTMLFDKYASLDSFRNLIRNVPDYDGLASMYVFLRKNIRKVNPSVREPRKLYDLVLILLILSRDNVENNYSFLYQLWKYYQIHKIDYSTIFFSNSTIFNSFLFFEDFDLNRFIDNDYLLSGLKRARYDIDETVYTEQSFFDRFSIDRTEEIFITIKRDPEEFQNDAADNIFRNFLVNIWIHHHTEHELFKYVDDFFMNRIDRRLMQYHYEKYLQKYKNKGKFDVYFSEGSAKQLIEELGYLSDQNRYYRKTIREICANRAVNGSWDLVTDITAILRLANKNSESLDIENLYLYNPMYYYHKDYTVYNLPEALKVLTKIPSVISLRKYIHWIDKLQSMSDKGIRDVYCNFLNLFSSHSRCLRRSSAYDIKSHRISIGRLSTETLNHMNPSEIRMLFEGAIGRVTNSIDDADLFNAKKSIHRKLISDLISYYGVEVTTREASSKEKKLEQYPPDGDLFERGYLYESDFKEIKDKKIGIEIVSNMVDGNFSALPFLEMFDLYPKSEVKKKIIEIVSNALVAKVRYNMSPNFWVALYTIPALLVKHLHTPKKVLLKSLEIFLEISLIE